MKHIKLKMFYIFKILALLFLILQFLISHGSLFSDSWTKHDIKLLFTTKKCVIKINASLGLC